MLIRGAKPTWSKYLDVAIRANERVDLLFQSELAEIHGDDQIQEVVVCNNQTGDQRNLAAAAVFVFIGEKPQSDFVADLASCTESGHIVTGLDLMENGKPPTGWPLDRDPLLLETSVPGIFAAGDVRNGTKHGVAAAIGDGNTAVAMFWQYQFPRRVCSAQLESGLNRIKVIKYEGGDTALRFSFGPDG